MSAKRRMFKKRIVKKLAFTIANGFTIEVNTYALVRPTVPGRIPIRRYINTRARAHTHLYIICDPFH